MIKKYTDISGYNKQMDETIKISDSPVLGSPEWFYLKAQEPEMVKQKEIIEKCREGFLKLFSPDNLASMNGEELLTKVFSKIPSSMMSILLSGDQEYCLFGGICRNPIYGIIYQLRNSAQWKYNTEGFAKIISQEEAIKKAGLRVALDPMYGVSETAIKTILLTARCEMETIHGRHDTLFGGKLPAPSEALMSLVL